MTTASRGIAILVSTALLATTAMVPMASARDRNGPPHQQRHATHRGHDNSAALIGLGIFALAGAAIIAGASQPAQPVYAPQPYYPPQPAYAQPVYGQQVYGQASPTCTTINGYAACLAADGTWQYVR